MLVSIDFKTNEFHINIFKDVKIDSLRVEQVSFKNVCLLCLLLVLLISRKFCTSYCAPDGFLFQDYSSYPGPIKSSLKLTKT